MARNASAGIVLYRVRPAAPGGQDVVQVLLGHLGGPFWRAKDAGAWTIPKGEVAPGEAPLAAAIREFAEETGQQPPTSLVPLGDVRQGGGKVVSAWAAEGDLDPATASSNTVELEWPPRSGRRIEVPELDRVAWFDLADARRLAVRGQSTLFDRLLDRLVEQAPRGHRPTQNSTSAPPGGD